MLKITLPEDAMPANSCLAVFDHHIKALDPGLLLGLLLLGLGGGHLLLDKEGRRVSLLGAVVDPDRREYLPLKCRK